MGPKIHRHETSGALESGILCGGSGIKVSYNTSNPGEQRITSLTLSDGSPVERGTTYTVAANSFIATGGDGFTVFKEGQNQETVGSDVDALEAHVSTLPQPFGVPTDFGQRITKQG